MLLKASQALPTEWNLSFRIFNVIMMVVYAENPAKHTGALILAEMHWFSFDPKRNVEKRNGKE